MRHRRVLLAVVVGLLGLVPGTGRAEPHDAKITGVYASKTCASDPCTSSDTPLKEGAIVGGEIQVFVSAQADLGLEWVRLEAQFPGDPRFYCLEFWNANRATSFKQMRRWNTTHWTDPRSTCTPESCSHCIETSPHQHGRLSDNVPHTLRVVAHEQVSGASDDKSDGFTIKLQNPASAPAWKADPVSSSSSESAAVSLLWEPAPEPDVVEYRYVRTSPAGARDAFAINAEHPERQGCQRLGDGTFKCVDSIPAGAPSGSYRYAVAAVRRAFTGPACEVASGRCLVGPLSQTRAVAVSPPPAASTGPSASASPGASTSPTSGTGRAPVSVTPPPEQNVAAGSGPGKAGSSPILPLVAGALIVASAGAAGWLQLSKRRRA